MNSEVLSLVRSLGAEALANDDAGDATVLRRALLSASIP